MVKRAVACGARPKKVSDYERGLRDGAALEREQCALACETIARTTSAMAATYIAVECAAVIRARR